MSDACRACGSDTDILEGTDRLACVASDATPAPVLILPRLVACRGCGLVQAAATPTWDHAAEVIYHDYRLYHQSGGDEQRLFDGDGGSVPRSECVLAYALPLLEPTGRLLDVGCGTGGMLRAAHRLLPDWALVGHDLDARMEAAIVAIPGVERLETGPIEEIRDRFDLITLSHVLEHLPSPVETLRALGRLLAPGGRLLIEVPDARCNPFDLAVVDHASHFTVGTLASVLGLAGLDGTVGGGVVPKELTALTLGRPSDAAWLPCVADDPSWAEAHIAWLARAADELGGCRWIFGSSVASVWLSLMATGAVVGFVDEDASRVGRTLQGAPIVAVADVPSGAEVALPFAPPLADRIAARLRSARPDVRWRACGAREGVSA